MSTPENIDIAGLVMSFHDVIRKDVQSELPESCSVVHIKVLEYIAREKSPSMTDIADHLRITSPGATMIADKLIELKELDRKADPTDRRIVRLVITEKGRQVLEHGMKCMKKLISVRLASLSKTEQKQFAEILTKLIKK